MHDQVSISLISAVSGVIIAYIINVASKKVQQNRQKSQPKDRMEQMFDGYERLIKQKDVEDDRKVKAMQALEEELVLTRRNVQRLEKALAQTQQELLESREENKELHTLLAEMRKEYKNVKEA